MGLKSGIYVILSGAIFLERCYVSANTAGLCLVIPRVSCFHSKICFIAEFSLYQPQFSWLVSGSYKQCRSDTFIGAIDPV